MKRSRKVPRRRWRFVLAAVAAFVLFAASVALLVNTVPLATNWLGAEDAVPEAEAGPAVLHDDAGDTNRYSYPLRAGRVTELDAGASSAVTHDDAGDTNRYSYPLRAGRLAPDAAGATLAVVHDDAGNLVADLGEAVVHDDAGNFPQ